jgi:hypothetical protein
VREIADEFKIATRSIAKRSDLEQLNMAVQLGVLTKDEVKDKVKALLNL